MRRHEYESRYNPAVTELSRALRYDDNIRPDTLDKIKNVLDGIEITDRIINEKEQVISQKEQLLVQKERELESLRQITDNSSNVVRNTINESKDNLDKATDLLNSGKFSEALKYSDIALYNIESIDNLGLQTLEQANNLYLERNQQYVESAAKRDNFYKQGVINGVNAFSWVKDNPTRDFYTFFRETLKVSDKSPENVNLINNRLYYNLPKYLQEAQRANHFYNEYNKYYDAMTKLQQVVNIHNIRAASSKGLKDYEEALKSCEIALEIDPQNLTLSNLKNAILQEKQNEEASKLEENNLLVSQIQEIERLKEQLSQKEIETQELLTRKELEKQELIVQKEREKQELLTLQENQLRAQKDEDVHNKSAEKNRIIEELASNLLTKDEVIVSKDLKIGEVSQSVKKANRKLAAKDKLLNDKEQRLEELKLLIEQNRIEKEELLAQVVNKSHMKNQIIDELEEEINLQEDEVGNLRVQNLEKELMNQKQEKLLIQKDIELENLLEQKDEEVRNKSLVKNQIIGGLHEAMTEKEKEALYSQIELLKKQLEFKDKEAEDARIISELKDQLLTLKALYGHDVSFAEEFSAIQFRAENSIANNDFGDIADLSRYISRLVEAERDNSVSADFSNLLANISPINHGEEQPIYRSIYIEDRSVQPGESLAERQMESLDLSSMMNQDRQNQVVQTGVSIIAGEQMSVPLNQGNIMNHGAQNQNLIGNFDIDNQHITHSVALGGEGSESFSIIDAENSH